MANYIATDVELTATADSIRDITGDNENIEWKQNKGFKDALDAITKKSAATYTPTTVDQTIAAGQYLTGDQTIEGEENLVAGNIKTGVSIFGVTGSYGGAPEAQLDSKSISANGTYNASADALDGYSSVSVNVPNSYAAGDEGKVVSSGALVAQSSKSISSNGIHDTTTNDEVVVNVPNSYAAGDEGKVVSSGELVAQSSKSITTNGTHDTTTNNSVTVSVPNSYDAGDEGKVVSSGELVTQSSKTVKVNGTYDTTTVNSTTVNYTGEAFAKIGTGTTITTVGGLYGPTTEDSEAYIVPVSFSGDYVSVNSTESYEIGMAFIINDIPTGVNEIGLMGSLAINYPTNTYVDLPYLYIQVSDMTLHANIYSGDYTNGYTSNNISISNSTFSPQLDTEASIRVVYNGTSLLIYGDDGRGTEGVAASGAYTPYQCASAKPAFGFGNGNSYPDTTPNIVGLAGSYINVDKCYVKQGNAYLWKTDTLVKEVNQNGTYLPESDSKSYFTGIKVNVPNTYDSGDEGKVVSSGALVAQSSKSITTNGTHDTTTNNSVTVSVPNSYAAGDEGKVVSSGELVAQSSKSITTNGTHDTTTNNSVTVSVPNSYAAGDEGKVVSSGELVAQSSTSITTNGTHDTTTNNSVTVNVPNTYSSSDAGKVVVANGLYTQSNRLLTKNGVYNTTTNDEVVASDTSAGLLYVKVGSATMAQSFGGMYGPLGDYTKSYLIPVSNGSNVGIDTTQPFEIKFTYWVTKGISEIPEPTGYNYYTPFHLFGGKSELAVPRVSLYAKKSNGSLVFDHEVFIQTLQGSSIVQDTQELTIAYKDGLPPYSPISITITYDGLDVLVTLTDGVAAHVDNHWFTNVNLAPSQSGEIAFGAITPDASGVSTDNFLSSQTWAYIDLYNTYIKQNGTKIWGI